jgi:hypothetical protein
MLEDILLHGAKYPLEPLGEESRVKDLELALEFGNHRELVNKDVIHGYGIVLPLNKMIKIPKVVMAPMNIAPQNTINEFGQIISKDRLTHDQSFLFKGGSGTSVNSRVIKEELPPCMFGSCVRRLINYIVALRFKYPDA